jgi:hypothetical protein
MQILGPKKLGFLRGKKILEAKNNWWAIFIEKQNMIFASKDLFDFKTIFY